METNYAYSEGLVGPDHNFIQELRTRIADASIDELKHLISTKIIGRTVVSPVIASNTFLYRARKVDGTFGPHAPVLPRDLSYPPGNKCKAMRLNRAGRPLFYCSNSKAPLLYELDAQIGDEYVLSIWQMTADAVVNNIGFTARSFANLGSSRRPQSWRPTSTGATGQEVDSDFLSDLFTERVGVDEEDKYKITAAIAEIHYELLEGHPDRIAGLLYPSVKASANADNLALLPWFVDSHVRWIKAIHIRVTGADTDGFTVEELDGSIELASDGFLRWIGCSPRLLKNVGGTVECTFRAGPDAHGDYQNAADGAIGHWHCVSSLTGVLTPY